MRVGPKTFPAEVRPLAGKDEWEVLELNTQARFVVRTGEELLTPLCTCEPGSRGDTCRHIRWVLGLVQKQQDAAEQARVAQDMLFSSAEVGESADDPHRTRRGYLFGEVTSALQKEIRGGDEEAAVFWALELYDVAPAYTWKRLLIIACEDIGFGDPQAVVLVSSLASGWKVAREASQYGVQGHLVTMATMALARAPKSTEVEDLQSYTIELQKRKLLRPVPEYARDAHTAAGKARNAPWTEWYDDRHFRALIPLNPYLARIAKLEPKWFSDRLRRLLPFAYQQRRHGVAGPTAGELERRWEQAAEQGVDWQQKSDEAWAEVPGPLDEPKERKG